MQKSIWKSFYVVLAWFAVLASVFMTGCQQNEGDDNGNSSGVELADKVIFQAKDDAGEEFISVSDDDWANDYELKSDFQGKPPMIDFGDGLDLTGYKYLNIEFYCPDGDYHLIGFTGFSFDPYEKVVRTRVSASKEAKIVQVPFGVNHGEWPSPNPNDENKALVQPNVSNKLNRLYTLVFDQFDVYSGNVPGVKVYIKKITATNTEIKKDPEKDFVVFSAIESEGHKITTIKNEDSGKGDVILFGCGEIGEMDLADYKYLNVELYSPNIKSYPLQVEGWSETYRTGEYNEEIVHLQSLITSEPKVYQVPFNDYWYNYETRERKPIQDKILSHIWFYIRDYEADYEWVDGIDVYVKKIVATNKKIDLPKEKVVFEAEDSNGYKITTLGDAHWKSLYLGNIDLKDYKYLNVELSAPCKDDYFIDIDAWGENERVAEYDEYISDGPVILQSLFGTNRGTWKDWPDGNEVILKSTSNVLSSFAIAVQNSNYECIPDIDVYIKRVWATNEKLVNDTSKDKIIFSSAKDEGYKITTKEGEHVWFQLFDKDVEGYKYLNVELYSPNSGNHKVVFDNWVDDNRVSMNDYISEQPKIIQEKLQYNQLGGLAAYARGFDINDWAIPDVDIYIKRIWATNTEIKKDYTKDLVLYKAEDDKGHKFTSESNWRGLDVGPKDLEGYKYLNIELYSPVANGNVFTFDCWGDEKDGSQNVANFNTLLTTDPVIIQSDFGKTYDGWFKNGVNTPPTTSMLNWVNFGVHYNREWNLIEGVEFYIKRIWATNTKLENDTSKDKTVFLANDDIGYKITTESDWKNFSIGTRHLEGYKYLNIEFYSPNSGNYDIKIDGWSGGAHNERVSEFHTKLSSEPKTVQVLFGVNRGTWGDWINDVWTIMPSTSNDLNSFAIGAHLGDDWNLKDGIDIYIKRIWATNTEL